ncbi:MAG: hypothetical protein J0I44_09595 [Microbacterium sp.]|uniref:hypothetical protein n=1 Tax=Microbacterium sp. TaxID=51671 RepID=UPI001AD3FC07|nr:hypothetical protein [Microbacterium sp.]MBN9154988.1 hypothetical protein [Microbacterium sp.]MBN9169506.1 hypothetical protein [Microbacterium sp.]MBN9171929.1 hypothetical protein [Microbacterium sp.]MBN9174993.1 hypothetical protein [Microbacterium sp.]MBN9182879.1 hypothetical protein [Microbacterium sp.]
MFIVSILLFIVGIACFGLAFSVVGWQAVIFILGILLVSAAMAIPIHTTRRNNQRQL